MSFPRVLLDWMPSSAASDADAGVEDGSSNLTRFSRTPPWCVSSLGLTGSGLPSWPFATLVLFALPRLRIDFRFRHTCWSQVPRHSFETLPTCLIHNRSASGNRRPSLPQTIPFCSDTNHGTRSCVLSKIPGIDEPRLQSLLTAPDARSLATFMKKRSPNSNESPAHVLPCSRSKASLPSGPFLNLAIVSPAKVGIPRQNRVIMCKLSSQPALQCKPRRSHLCLQRPHCRLDVTVCLVVSPRRFL